MSIRLKDVRIDERTYVRFTAELIWSEALRLAAQGLLLITSVLPAWWVMVNSGRVPVATLLAWLLPVPLWMAFSYPVGARQQADRLLGRMSCEHSSPDIRKPC